MTDFIQIVRRARFPVQISSLNARAWRSGRDVSKVLVLVTVSLNVSSATVMTSAWITLSARAAAVSFEVSCLVQGGPKNRNILTVYKSAVCGDIDT